MLLEVPLLGKDWESRVLKRNGNSYWKIKAGKEINNKQH